jgi:hypothetical protein
MGEASLECFLDARPVQSPLASRHREHARVQCLEHVGFGEFEVLLDVLPGRNGRRRHASSHGGPCGLTPDPVCKLLGHERLLLERPDKAIHPLTCRRQLSLGGSQFGRLDRERVERLLLLRRRHAIRTLHEVRACQAILLVRLVERELILLEDLFQLLLLRLGSLQLPLQILYLSRGLPRTVDAWGGAALGAALGTALQLGAATGEEPHRPCDHVIPTRRPCLKAAVDGRMGAKEVQP